MNAVTEDELKAHQKDVGGKRITMEDIHANIKDTYYHVVEGSCLTICVLTLQNGFQVTGESACADPAMYDAEIGKRIAQDNAIKKIWPLMGYMLKQEVYLSGGNFKDRLHVERNQLEDRLLKLRTFISGSVGYESLPDQQKRLLNEQCQSMANYLNILELRIQENA